MNTLRLALIPGLIAGVVSIFTSWLWMGVIFHRYQQSTPSTWRPEGLRNHFLSSVLHLLAAVAIATFFLFVARFNVGIFGLGFHGAFRFAAILWMALAAPLAVEAAIYINLHPFVVVGQLLDWLTTSLLACLVTAWWRHA
jgi:hypothetical protein